MRKYKTDDILVCILFIMQLGFHTKGQYDEMISLVISALIAFYFCFSGSDMGKVILNTTNKRYVIWYTLFVCVCVLTIFTCKSCNLTMLKRLFTETYIPTLLCTVALTTYLKHNKEPKILLKLIVYAEVIVSVRVLLNTPIIRVIKELNTTLYGEGLGVSYNNFTTPLALIFCISIYLLFFCKEKIYTSSLFLALNILFSGSRKAMILSAVCFVGMYLLTSDRKNISKKIKTVLVVLAISVITIIVIMTNDFLYSLLGSKIVSVIQSMGMDYAQINSAGIVDESVRGRAVLREMAVQVFKDNPIIGVGYYGFMYYNQLKYYAHNNYLELLADLGIVGFTAYYWYYVNVIFSALKQRKINRHCDFSYRPDILVLVFMVLLLTMEYGQVTYFRMFMLMPFITVIFTANAMYRKEVMTVEQ